MRLANRVALVTGAAQGIGKGIAEAFAQEGADVVINDINGSEKAEALAKWIRGLGRRAMVVQADASNRDQVGVNVRPRMGRNGPGGHSSQQRRHRDDHSVSGDD